MTCIKKQSIKEILYWLWIKDATCTRKVMKINRILRMFYLDTYEFSRNVIAHKFTSTWEEQEIITEHNINHIWWFFSPSSLQDSTCWCMSFDAKWDERKMVKMTESKFDSGVWLYSIEWQKKIKATLPNTWEYYIIYSKWAPSINSICDTLEIDDFMLTGLEFLIEWFYSRDAGNLNRQQSNSSDYEKWLEKSSRAQANSIIYIWM